MIFAVVKRCCPRGKPAGMTYPAGSKNGWPGSIPESMIPIFTPWPAVSSACPQSAGAPICCGDVVSWGA